MNKIKKYYNEPRLYSSTNRNKSTEKIVVIPGYGETIEHNKDLVDALTLIGFDAFTFSQPRRSIDPANAKAINQQAAVVASIIEKATYGDEKIHAVAHSMGSGALLKAALNQPERFASITLMQPMGMVGVLGLKNLVARAGKKAIKNQRSALSGQNINKSSKKGYAATADFESIGRLSSRVAQAQLTSLGYLATNPRLSIREASEAGGYSINEDLEKVMDLGIPVHIVLSRGDELFKYEDLDLKSLSGPSSISSVADYDAGHDTFWMQPKRTAQMISQLIKQSI